jgi:zinc carboxypeptidase
MPPAPPVRPAPVAYHFHTYDYPGAAAPFVASAGQPTAGHLQFYSLVQDLNGLVAIGGINNVPNLALTQMSLVPGGAQTSGGNETLMLSFGPAPGVVNAPAVVITGGIHAREWIAPEIAYLLAEYLIVNYTTAPHNRFQRTIRSLVDSRRIYIIPMLNPDGNLFSVFTAGGAGRDWRKNRRNLPATPALWVNEITGGGGPNPPPFTNVNVPLAPAWATAQYNVPDYDPGHGIPPGIPARQTRDLANGQVGVDLNRNLATQAWGYDAEMNTPLGPLRLGSDPSLNLYFGPRAGFEVETANVQVALTHAAPGISVAIDYHSYAQAILYPSEVFNNGAVGPDYKILGMTLRQLVRSQAARDYELGSPAQRIGYDATGSVIDRAAQQHQARAFTIELDPPQNNPIAFQLPEADIQTVFEKNIRGALAALAAPARPGNWFTAGLQGFPMGFTMLQFLTWNVYGRGNQLPA